MSIHDADSTVSSPFLHALAGGRPDVTPVWLMRQAGRYLPEYRALRAKAPTFMDFCRTPELAAEATLQPIRRFNLDAAIIFSDILIIPDALGQSVSFETGEGPKLDPIDHPDKLDQLSPQLAFEKLEPVFKAITLVKQELPASVPLIGFCGAPWTVASYMIAGRGTPDQAPARLFAYKYPHHFEKIINLLCEESIKYINKKIENGVDAVQIFDSWAGVLPAGEFEAWCMRPLKRIAKAVRARNPEFPIIAFPRGASTHLQRIAEIPEISAVSLDTAVDPAWAAAHVQTRKPVQGNLDPICLLAGGARLDESVDRILEAFQDKPHIFNLGHGILPQTPIENVERMIDRVRRGRLKKRG